MTNFPLTNVFLIAGIVFLLIAVLGQTKLGFAEINPGCFGRTLALLIGLISLAAALVSGTTSVETLDLLRTYLTNLIQQSIGFVNDFLAGS
ncbi:hypothetical protein [Nostoc sp. 106C]|uniref:hypothetical protein n=1 Tax=Nostoc sp. 106C TaxID=1932667 RepID=UPI000A38F2B4|nr:hypothetical protein [Nostoc sp. 106C]OUL24726.1 hypothetical protein BV378_17780 [Nostoc sp. RF31YmG]OUL29280.1 hypothetical protein BV375_15825 [Nostoc sp. 106C]